MPDANPQSLITVAPPVTHNRALDTLILTALDLDELEIKFSVSYQLFFYRQDESYS